MALPEVTRVTPIETKHQRLICVWTDSNAGSTQARVSPQHLVSDDRSEDFHGSVPFSCTLEVAQLSLSFTEYER